MKTVLPRRTDEHEYDFTVRQIAYCSKRVDHCYQLQFERRETGNHGAAVFYQLEARTWQIRADQFRAYLDGYIHGTKVRHDELFGPFASIMALIPERTVSAPHIQIVGRGQKWINRQDYGAVRDLMRDFVAGHNTKHELTVIDPAPYIVDRARAVADAVIVKLPVREKLADARTYYEEFHPDGRLIELSTCNLCGSSNGHSLSCVAIMRDYIEPDCNQCSCGRLPIECTPNSCPNAD